MIEWGVRTSNGNVRECADEPAADALLAKSTVWVCVPAWRKVRRIYEKPEWS